jgi:hypothetical protein
MIKKGGIEVQLKFHVDFIKKSSSADLFSNVVTGDGDAAGLLVPITNWF